MKLIFLIAAAVVFICLLPRLFAFFVGGRRYGNKIATSIGIENNLFHEAIQQGGLGNNSLMMLESLRREGVSPFDAAPMFGQFLIDGLNILELRFGPQPQIEKAMPIAIRLVERAEEINRMR